ncbi:hypothetical protein FACS189421_02650 [Bacteroidia bacterium]|nr:hypothetical protein FACS189421_02650 [Bacteroidia bacterium]
MRLQIKCFSYIMNAIVNLRKRHFIISGKHKRLQRLWQFFFTGWGLIAVATLAAAPFFTRDIIWTPVSGLSMNQVQVNQFKMDNAAFSGIDTNGEPFSVNAKTATQRYDSVDKIFMEGVRGRITRNDGGLKITDNISADSAVMDRARHNITLTGNVAVDSSNGDKIRTKELVVKI